MKNKPKKNQKYKNKRFKSFIKTDRAILMICIGIAFVFWLITKFSYSYKDSIIINLNYIIPSEKVFTFPPSKELLVDIEANGWDLLGLAFSSAKREINIVVEANEIRTISASSLNNKVMNFIPDVNILNITPEIINIQTEAIASKKIPVILDHQIQLAPLHQFVDGIRIDPETIEITGPASVIRDIYDWKTNVYIPSNKIEKDINVELTLVTNPNSNIKTSTKIIKCKAEVEAVTEKQIDVPVKVINAPDSLLLVILPKKVKINCRVGLSDYHNLDSDDFDAIVDFKDFDIFNKTKIKVDLQKKPNFVKHIQCIPYKVEYIIRSRKLI
ncbi:MAG: CdaR family protein [Saprospiraceae bacterium]|nr:CdaR family protein [Saprospiraceae bacterium]